MRRCDALRIHAVTEAQSVRCVMEGLSTGRGGWVVTPNLDHLRRLAADLGDPKRLVVRDHGVGVGLGQSATTADLAPASRFGKVAGAVGKVAGAATGGREDSG